ncbi:hypothetical protein LTR37_009007 [Vermiconidia calcicola]|uniref:Uncharacterized protein n=1 Tax=Vermiconidia calcicola TaxID=1690605 RepID=A0ACC3N8V5_9PEZI|nr:hypothetical protein LTR37_009007 [Vermiconidia calcicola]
MSQCRLLYRTSSRNVASATKGTYPAALRIGLGRKYHSRPLGSDIDNDKRRTIAKLAADRRLESFLDNRRWTSRPRKGVSQAPQDDVPVEKTIVDLKASLGLPHTSQTDVSIRLQKLQPWLYGMPAERLTQEAKYHQIGAHVLNWVWANKLEQTRRFHQESRFIQALCFFLVAEQQHDYIKRWMTIESGPQLVEAIGKAALVWRSKFWRFIVEAELYLPSPEPRSADTAILRFFEIKRLVRSFPFGSEVAKTSAFPALTPLLLLFVSKDIQGPRELNSDPYPFLEYLKAVTENGENPIGALWEPSLWAYNKRARELRRLRDVLNHLKDHASASWLTTFEKDFTKAVATLDLQWVERYPDRFNEEIAPKGHLHIGKVGHGIPTRDHGQPLQGRS